MTGVQTCALPIYGKKLKAKITAKKGGTTKTKEVEFETKYNEVDWVDVRIDKNRKRVDVTLRVDLKEADIQKSVNKTFNDLLSITIEGLKKYWGRNKTRSIGDNVKIGNLSYEIFINPVNNDLKSMPTLNVFASTEDYGRSRNWWASRSLFYNDGYHYSFYSKSRLSLSINDGVLEDEKEFKHTAAHEIGHEILQAFGGKNNYSYIHKGTSTLLTQDVKKESVLPLSGEIDLMKYYSDDYINIRSINSFYERNIAGETDVLGLLWLTKLKIK